MSCSAAIGKGVEISDFPPINRRPTSRISDIWSTPLHDFPMRDEILYQWLPLSKTDRILEIGTGSGLTAFRLSREVAQVTTVDVAAPNIERLRNTYPAVPHLRYVCADASSPTFLNEIPDSFDAVFGLDFFEYVTDPLTCMRNLSAATRPGGVILLQWPNYPPSITGGVTYIETHTELSDLLTAAGLRTWEAFALQLRPHAAALYKFLHELPLRHVRRFRRPDGQGPPQTFDETWAFQRGQRLKPWKVLIHTYWASLSAAMRVGGECFKRIPVGNGSMDCNLLLLARR